MSDIDIKVELFSLYQEYVSNFYPSDPNIYVIRANPQTVFELLAKGVEYQIGFSDYDLSMGREDRFLGFRLKPDTRLPVGDIIFGPETVDIKWSK